MNRILFLDIDGVMLPFGGDARINETRFSPDAVAAVREAKDLGFKLILHSSWRHDLGELRLAHHLFESEGIPLDGCVDCDEPSKARAILTWLDEHYGEHWPAFVVVDDDPMEFTLTSALAVCRPDFRLGLDRHGLACLRR
jgi:hypothetical protein